MNSRKFCLWIEQSKGRQIRMVSIWILCLLNLGWGVGGMHDFYHRICLHLIWTFKKIVQWGCIRTALALVNYLLWPKLSLARAEFLGSVYLHSFTHMQVCLRSCMNEVKMVSIWGHFHMKIFTPEMMWNDYTPSWLRRRLYKVHSGQVVLSNPFTTF